MRVFVDSAPQSRGIIVVYRIEEELLCEAPSFNRSFVLAPACAPVLSAERHPADCESKKGGNTGTGAVTRVKALRK